MLKSKHHRVTAKQDRKIREKFAKINDTIENHFPDNHVWLVWGLGLICLGNMV